LPHNTKRCSKPPFLHCSPTFPGSLIAKDLSIEPFVLSSQARPLPKEAAPSYCLQCTILDNGLGTVKLSASG
jgi:hypothetical protein